MAFIGVDLGGTKLAAAAFTEAGELLHREHAAGGPARVRGWTAHRGADRGHFQDPPDRGAPVSAFPGCTGRLAERSGPRTFPNGTTTHCATSCARRSARTSATIDSDRAAYILGETWRGAAAERAARSALAVGTGIGAGILTDGRVLRGAADVAGAIGWLALDRPYVARYRTHGCFEDQASGPRLVRVARDLMERDPRYE